MRKQIFSAAAAILVAAAMSVSALAVAPGSTNGTASATVATSRTEATTVVPQGVADVQVVISAGAFDVPDGALVEIDMDIEPVSKEQEAEIERQIMDKLEALAVSSGDTTVDDIVVKSVNTRIDISAYLDNAEIEPNGDITITIAYDGASNKVAHFLDNGSIELLDLRIDGEVCAFTTKSFSEFYMITVEEEDVTPDNNNGNTNSNEGPKKDNPATGVVLAVIPAAVAAAAVVVFKKRK